jgi:hypothetical protein
VSNPDRKHDNRTQGVWTVQQARDRFEELLDAAANKGPQEIHDTERGIVFGLEKSAASKKSGRDFLLKGGPLDDRDIDPD